MRQLQRRRLRACLIFRRPRQRQPQPYTLIRFHEGKVKRANPYLEVHLKNKLSRILIYSLSVIGLGIVGLVTADIITTLRVPAPGSAVVAASPSPASNTQQPATPPQEPTTEVAYPVPVASALFPSPTLNTFVPWFMQALQTYQEALKAKNLSAEDRQSLETKVAMYGRMATQWAISKKVTPNPEPQPTYELRHFPTPTFSTGLFEGGTSDFHSFAALIQNSWAQFVNNNEYIIVYAGELGSATEYPGRGVVIVRRETDQGRWGRDNEYMLPEGTGWVRISEIKGDYLVLTSKEGKTFYFYVPGQQFVPSLTDVAPTVTPLPTALPSPTIGPTPTMTQVPAYPSPSPPYPGP